jgi:hypothetical protein
MSRIFTPKANQGPLLGIFITGPAGAIVGFIAGALFSQRHWCSNANHLTKRYSQPLADWCWSAFNTDQHQPIFIRHIQSLSFLRLRALSFNSATLTLDDGS